MNSTVASVFTAWLHDTDLIAMLLSTTQHWWTTMVPLLLCVVAVHLVFRHAVTLVWFTLKLVIAVGVYVEVKHFVESSVGIDSFRLQALVFGMAGGAMEMSRTIGSDLLKQRAMLLLSSACPSCFPWAEPGPEPEPEPEPVATPEPEEVDTSWISWIRST